MHKHVPYSRKVLKGLNFNNGIALKQYFRKFQTFSIYSHYSYTGKHRSFQKIFLKMLDDFRNFQN